jgi:hypothetical protein
VIGSTYRPGTKSGSANERLEDKATVNVAKTVARIVCTQKQQAARRLLALKRELSNSITKREQGLTLAVDQDSHAD